jgi:hypothetical protein
MKVEINIENKGNGGIYKDIVDVYLLAKYMIQAGYVLPRQGSS